MHPRQHMPYSNSDGRRSIHDPPILSRHPPQPHVLPAHLAPDDVPSTFEWLAPFYDVFAWLVARRARRLALDWAAVHDGETVLEVAVGTGVSFGHLLHRNPGGWTEGIDRSPAMLRRARRRARRAPTDRYSLRRGDARTLDYADRAFDCILSSYMFDLLPEREFVPVLRELHRVLRPGGRLVLVTETTARRRHERLWDHLYALYPPLMGGCRGVHITPALAEAGFTLMRRQHMSQMTFPSVVLHAIRREDQRRIGDF